MKKASGNFVVEKLESKGINLMYDYLGFQSRKDIVFPLDFESHFAGSRRIDYWPWALAAMSIWFLS